MYDIIKNVIMSGSYELADMLKKIDTKWMEGALTDEQRTELIELARTNAEPENTYAPLQEQIDLIAADVKTLQEKVAKLEGGGTEPEEEYPAWVQPTGAHDAYNTGGKMTYTDGKKYICKMDGCVWGPDVYPQGWELVEK